MTRKTKPQKYDQYFPKPEGKETKGKEREEKEGRKEGVKREGKEGWGRGRRERGKEKHLCDKSGWNIFQIFLTLIDSQCTLASDLNQVNIWTIQRVIFFSYSLDLGGAQSSVSSKSSPGDSNVLFGWESLSTYQMPRKCLQLRNLPL